MTEVYLASSSPRRAEILGALGVRFVAAGTDVDETIRAGESASEMVVRLAEAKARAALPPGNLPVLGSDTAVTLGARIFGKPTSEQDALEMLSALSGNTHEVLTAVALLAGGRMLSEVSRTEVRFRSISTAEARRYWQSGEPVGKAGGYAIQGRAAVFIPEILGSYTGVMGLPLYETAALLRNFQSRG